MSSAAEPLREPPATVYRHRIATRIWHWITAISVFIMIGSGLGISNAHPYLYWGSYGANFDAHWIALPHWPAWLTIPESYNLAMSRRWHLLFAPVLAFALLGYMIASLANGHFARDLSVRAREAAPRHLWADARAHLAFRFHDPARPGAYNTLQKLSYVATVFVLLPVLIFTGLAISPGMDAAWPWLLDLFGGRQTARSIHFIAMVLIALFVVVHLVFVILAGPVNELASMISGRWRVPEDAA